MLGRAALDLRLVPAALAVWASVALLLAVPEAGLVLLAAGVAVVAVMLWLRRLQTSRKSSARAVLFASRALPTAVAPVLVASVGLASTWLQIRRAARHPLYAEVGGVATTRLTLASDPEMTKFGASATASVPGVPGRVPVFGDEDLLGLRRDMVVESSVAVRESTRPSLSGLQLTLRGDAEIIRDASGVTARVRQTLREVAEPLWPGADRLFPAMAIGDESRFSPADRALLNDSGLSHLSAVSGAIVALVVGAAMLAMSWVGPRVRVSVAGAVLVGFVAVVGVEPSVLRAAVTGTVGLVAILVGRAGSRWPPCLLGSSA